ncbi:hypothetical protein [Halomicrobium salinisoli]|uniref:hypothetical protein n=1 Tax=Halomicrobium salinisoli TaxID=2878391 RepID=UPI001CF08DEE|nr:hypothetical protein [Halomicrobium salinisoli]
MPGVAVTVGLLALNLGLLAAVFAFGRRDGLSSSDRCFVCSTADPGTAVSGVPVCRACRDEYFAAVA